MRRRLILVLAIAGPTGVGHLAPLFAELPRELTPATYEAIKARVEPRPGDFAWQELAWRDGFFEGLLAAQAEDKPIFYWLYEGDPRANC